MATPTLPTTHGNQIALEFDDATPGDPATAADLAHRYLWGVSVDQILADEKILVPGTAGEILWPLTDHLGTVRDLIESDGTVAAHLVYDSFGNLASGTNPGLFGFTGRPLERDTGLQNNLNTWYDLRTRRWVSEDPIGFAADLNLNRYCQNNPVIYVDPTGLIDVSKNGPKYGSGSPLPTSEANNITTYYRFFDWLNTDLGYMMQQVTDEGTFSFSADHAGGSISWREGYYEGWVRRPMARRYFCIDRHSASPRPPAQAVENFFGKKFRLGRNNTLFLGEWQVCEWDFTMRATFDMRNAWRDDWVPLSPGPGIEAYFGGSGNLAWEASLTASTVGAGGGMVWLESNQNNGALYGFGKMLFPNKGVPPPVGRWAFGTYHVTSQKTWTESWKSGQAKPTMKYTGGYGAAP